MPRCAWVLLLLLCGCPRPPPTPVEPRPAKPRPIQIPPGCGPALTGDWQHQDDPTFRYHVEDDRTDVTVWVYRVFPPAQVDAGRPSKLFPRADAGVATRDAGGAPDAGVDAGSSDAGAADPTPRYRLPADLLPRDGGAPPLVSAVIHLQRSPDGFVGEAQVQHLLSSGRECQATFATRITACTPSTLTLSSATSTPVGEGCQTPSLPQPAAMLEHRLARTDAGAL